MCDNALGNDVYEWSICLHNTRGIYVADKNASAFVLHSWVSMQSLSWVVSLWSSWCVTSIRRLCMCDNIAVCDSYCIASAYEHVHALNVGALLVHQGNAVDLQECAASAETCCDNFSAERDQPSVSLFRFVGLMNNTAWLLHCHLLSFSVHPVLVW